MEDREDGESTKGANDLDRNPFTELEKLEEEGMDLLKCLEDITSMDDRKDGENTRRADNSDKNSFTELRKLGEEGLDKAEYSGQDDKVNLFAGLDLIKDEGTSSSWWEKERNTNQDITQPEKIQEEQPISIQEERTAGE